MKKKFFTTLTALSLVFAAVIPSVNAQTVSTSSSLGKIKNVESFIIETLSKNQEGFYVPSGYKEVNAISEIEKQGDQISTIVSTVEDYYDLNNNFINSDVKHTEFNNNLTTGKAQERSTKNTSKANNVEVSTHTLLKTNVTTVATTKNQKYYNATLSDNQKLIVEQAVNTAVSKLDKADFKDVVGIKQSDIDKVKAEVQAQTLSKASISPLSVSMHGAYDNYYNYDFSTGAYRVQALSAQSRTYIRYTGNTIGNPTDSDSLNTFQGYINNYETYTQQYMDGANFGEVTGWASSLAGLALIVAGFAAGPEGWVAIVLNYSGALSTFIGLTSSVYGTVSRLNLSQTAAQYEQNARTMMFQGGGKFPNGTFSTVSGF